MIQNEGKPVSGPLGARVRRQVSYQMQLPLSWICRRCKGKTAHPHDLCGLCQDDLESKCIPRGGQHDPG